MGDLFSGCAYVRTYVAVTLRNLQSCLGMSICAHARNVDLHSRSRIGRHRETCIMQGRRWRTELGGRCLLAMEDREDSTVGPSQRTYLAESSAETSAERS